MGARAVFASCQRRPQDIALFEDCRIRAVSTDVAFARIGDVENHSYRAALFATRSSMKIWFSPTTAAAGRNSVRFQRPIDVTSEAS